MPVRATRFAHVVRHFVSLAAIVPLAGPALAAPAVPPAPSPIIALPLNPIVPAAQRACMSKAASGLGSTALKASEAAHPAKDDYVLVNYIGYLAADGQVFDQGMQAVFPVGGVIPGFSEGLQMMGKGAIYRLCVPAAQGYGAEGSGPVPANADLVFQVELLDYKTPAEVEAMRKARGDAAPDAPVPVPAPQQ